MPVRKGFLRLWAAAFGGVLACLPAVAGETVSIGGSGTGLQTMNVLVRRFQERNPDIRMTLKPSIGSSGAVKAVAKGALHIGMLSRPLKDDELGLGLKVATYARTPLVFAVSKDLPVSGLDRRQLLDILRGELQAWPNGKRIRLVLRPAADSDTEVVKGISPEIAAALDTAIARPGMLVALTNQECDQEIATIPGAIGFSTLTQIRTSAHRIKALALDGITPTAENLESGRYAIAKTLSFVTKPDPTAAVRRFIAFTLSPEGRRILSHTGNVPVADAPNRP